MPKSLLEDDFIEDEDFEEEEVETEDEDKEKDEDGLEVVIEDDTPEEDKGKWVASDDEEDDLEKDEDDEVGEYSKAVQKRIKKATARIHAERRRADQYNRETEEALNTAKLLLQENNRLKEMIENGESVLVKEHKERLNGALLTAQRAYREALEAEDHEAVAKAQTDLAKLAAELQGVERYRPQPLPRQTEEQIFPKRQVQPSVTERDMSWKKKNPWFGVDQSMTAVAFATHTRLTQQEGIMPEDPQYYKRIDAEMRKRFPERFDNGEQDKPRRRQPPVADARRGNRGAGKRTIKLNESQMRIARRLGLTPEQYAEGVAELERNDA